MNQSNYRRFLYVLPIVWMCLIFFFSSMNGTESSSMSNPVSGRLMSLIQMVFGDMEESSVAKMAEILEVVVRKGAHMAEYAVLYLTWYLALSGNGFGGRKRFWLPLLFCILYACTDEAHQLFVSERTGKLTDIGIDTCGSAIMMGICWRLRARAKKKTCNCEEFC